MQLMTLNSLLMFDVVFIFFLFLVGVTCLVYYLPPGKPVKRNINRHHCYHQHHHHSHSPETSHCHNYGHEEMVHYHQEQEQQQHQQQQQHNMQYCRCQMLQCENHQNVERTQNTTDDNNKSVKPVTFNQYVNNSFECSSKNFVTVEHSIIKIESDDVEIGTTIPQCCYVKAKDDAVKECTGPIDEV